MYFVLNKLASFIILHNIILKVYFLKEMSAFTKKLNQIKESLASDYGLKKPLTYTNLNSVNVNRTYAPLNITRVKSLSRCDIKVASP